MEKKELLDILEELFTDAYVVDVHCEHVLDQREVLKRIKRQREQVIPAWVCGYCGYKHLKPYNGMTCQCGAKLIGDANSWQIKGS